MVDIKKLLGKLTPKEKLTAIEIINLIIRKDTKGLDVKKLKGEDRVYRVRKGKIRVIYQLLENAPRLLFVGRRSDNTYRKL